MKSHVKGFFAFPTWILQLLYNLCSIGLFIGYLSIFDSSQYHKASYNDILTEMVIYNFISVFIVALVEKVTIITTVSDL